MRLSDIIIKKVSLADAFSKKTHILSMVKNYNANNKIKK
jgi:hypothetical protein